VVEKSAAAVQTAPSRPPVRAGKAESITERIERMRDTISRRAYELFDRDGRADGNHLRNWLEAESEFLHPVHVNLEETDGEFVVRAEVPGFTSSDLEVNVEPRRVTIAGKRETIKEMREGEALYSEECSDEIFRVIELPSEVIATKVSATLKDGVLDIQIPKAESKKSASATTQSA
jgi:HSP20 family molecular chaperone IbpA